MINLMNAPLDHLRSATGDPAKHAYGARAMAEALVGACILTEAVGVLLSQRGKANSMYIRLDDGSKLHLRWRPKQQVIEALRNSRRASVTDVIRTADEMYEVLNRFFAAYLARAAAAA